MNRILFFCLVLSLSIFIVNAQEEDLFLNSKNLIIGLTVSSGAEIKPESSDYSIEYIRVNLSHFPYESLNQQVISFDSSPQAETKDNALLFEWQKPRNSIEFGYKAKIKTNNDVVKITRKIQFPTTDLQEELRKFTKPAEIIDSDNEDVIEFASKLVEGEDDLYIVVNKIAEWTKENVHYNLSTLTANASQKASWVLEQRQGVCDELTSLFIAMLRSVGVPSKFVSGVAYTNSELFPENWGSHGWAEVYFPGFGWVPFDVTYGQFAYLDPTHIKLKESIDSAEPSVKYHWSARNVNLETKELDIDTSVAERIGMVQKPIAIDINMLKEHIGFGSYNLIEVSLENLEDYYVSSEIYLSKPKEILLEGNFAKNVVLKPRERKSVFWIIKVPESLEKNFVYTFPITISTASNIVESIDFKSTESDIMLSFEDVNEVLKQKIEEETKIYSQDVDIDCNIGKEEFYPYEETLVYCSINNLGNTFLGNLKFCLFGDCRKIDLGIAQTKSFNFSVTGLKEGKQQLALSLKSPDVSKTAYIDVDVLDAPKIGISGIEAPSEVFYTDKFKTVFLLIKESKSNPRNAKITLSNGDFEKTWVVEELAEDRKVIINLLGKDLKKGLNEFKINAKYGDNNRKTYVADGNFTVRLVNVTLVQNILLYLNSAAKSLEKPGAIIFITIAGILIFSAVVWLIFRKK